MSDYLDSDARAEQERQEKYGMKKTVFWIYWAIMIAGVGWWLQLVQWFILFCVKSVVSETTWLLWDSPSEGDYLYGSGTSLTDFLRMFRWVIAVVFAGWLTWKLQEPRWKNPRMWKKEEPKPIEPPKFFTGN